MFDKLLVCNRGEIAVRILRACRELGIRTVVGYSAADRESLAVRLADETFCLGPGPAGRSYLNISAILYALAATGATAVHPGYGFLSEDADFAQACESVGVTFVGPPSNVIRLMGDKIAARAAVRQVGVPCPAGTDEAVWDAATARAAAAGCGYPVVVKAAAGGGGRGMRVVRDPAELPAAVADRHERALPRRRRPVTGTDQRRPHLVPLRVGRRVGRRTRRRLSTVDGRRGYRRRRLDVPAHLARGDDEPADGLLADDGRQPPGAVDELAHRTHGCVPVTLAGVAPLGSVSENLVQHRYSLSC